MKSSRPPIIDPDKLREEISAYLDGELSAEDGREVEERLAAEPRFREELHRLEQAWRLLDELPRTEVDEKFAATTVELVAVKAADDLKNQQQQWPRQFARGWIFSAAGMSLALLLGFTVVAGGAALLSRAGVVHTADDRLLGDLSVLANLDEYQQVDSTVFLRSLADSNLFAANLPATDGPEREPLAQVGATPAQRRAYIEQLTPYERKDLSERRERMAALPADVQQRMRNLDHELSADPRAAELREVTARYGQWLMTLSLDVRAELRGLQPAERLARITQLRELDEKKLARQQAQQDLRVTLQWLQQVSQRHEELLKQQMLPPGPLDPRSESGPVRRTKMMLALLQRWQRYGFGKDPAVSAEEFAEFKQRLSPQLRERMDKQGPEMAAEWEILTSALMSENRAGAALEARRPAEGNALQQQARLAMFLRQLSDPSLEKVSEQELWAFFHRLPREERDRIKRLPREEGVQQLRALYARAAMREGGEPAFDRRHEPGGPRRFEPGRGPRGEDFRGRPRPDGPDGGGPGRRGPRELEPGPRDPELGPPGDLAPDGPPPPM